MSDMGVSDMDTAWRPLPQGRIAVSVACNDEGELVGLCLLRFDGGAVAVAMPAEFGADWEGAGAALRNAADVARLLAWAGTAARTAEFDVGSPIARTGLREGRNDPVAAGNLRYFGMGHWGLDVGTIEADPRISSSAPAPEGGS